MSMVAQRSPKPLVRVRSLAPLQKKSYDAKLSKMDSAQFFDLWASGMDFFKRAVPVSF